MLRESVDVWERSSLLMAKISKANRIKYFHFLQPNQYVTDSKQLSDEEKVIAYEFGHYPWKNLVKAGYPMLSQQGSRLKKSGVLFHDLTMMFKQEDRTVYSDKCCHFDKFGYSLIADKITETIIKQHGREQ